MGEKDIISSFETPRQQALRRLRRDSRDNGGAVIGYLSTSGETLAVTGDEEALYTKIINSPDEPVQVVVVGAPTGSTQIEGNVFDAASDGASRPVKIGGRAAGSIYGLPLVAVDDRVNAAFDQQGRQIIVIGGGDAWIRFNSGLATPAASFAPILTACLLGRLSITLAEATDMYALVYDGLNVVDRFFVPASGTAVRDYTTEGGLEISNGGLSIYLSISVVAIAAPATGGVLHAIYQTP